MNMRGSNRIVPPLLFPLPLMNEVGLETRTDASHENRWDTWQRTRYLEAGAKGGDGDPPYARDMSLLAGKTRSEFEKTGVFRYLREGD